MGLILITRMWERVERGRADSDIALFDDLMCMGEMAAKIIVAGLVAAIGDDRERSRYQQLYRLVRAEGIGEWGEVLDNVLTGPPRQYLHQQASTEQRELTQKCGSGTWQYEAVELQHFCLRLMTSTPDAMPTKIDGKRWITDYAQLRNKRAHGALSNATKSEMCPHLEKSLRVLTENYSIFKRQWAYLHQNISGKYKVVSLGNQTEEFDHLRSTSASYRNGVYVSFGEPRQVDLVESDVDVSDFYFANGRFNGNQYEMLSYISGNTKSADASPYLVPARSLPKSETEGIGTLDVQGLSFGNVPMPPSDYIRRNTLEDELLTVVQDDRHPIVTLAGSGGIGKTSLALTVLHKIAGQGMYRAILWFSARDIDLLSHGPKQVRPQVLTEKDIAQLCSRLLLSPGTTQDKTFDAMKYFTGLLRDGGGIGPILFVFDNFETVNRPIEMFSLIDTNLRLPNKVLITTRRRDFKGTYEIEVRGMEEGESNELIDATAERLGITSLLTRGYRNEIIDESEGHPYVMKILLGEVAKKKQLVSIERVFADMDTILTSLFERTYSNLSPKAQRVFLTLSNWRAIVPVIAIEAVLLRSGKERIDVEGAIRELSLSSFIQLEESATDRQVFISLPLTASQFGRTKLAFSPMKSAIEADTLTLQQFGAGQKTDIQHGIAPRIRRLIQSIARQISLGQTSLDDNISMLQFIATKYPPAWLDIAALSEESGSLGEAKDAVRRYLEQPISNAEKIAACKKLAELCIRSSDTLGEVHALVEMCELPEVPFYEISNASNRFNSLVKLRWDELDTDEKSILAERFARLMERRIGEAQASDLSRLAWLYIRLDDLEKAKQHVLRGLELEPENEYCLNLAKKLHLM